MILDKNWQAFFEAVKADKIELKKFTDRPKLPKYKDTVKGRNIFVYTIGAISSKQLKIGNGIESCVLGSRRVNPLEVKAKGERLNASRIML